MQRGDVNPTNPQVLSAILYLGKAGTQWRGLPKRFAGGHTIYMRRERWAKNGVLDQVCEQLQRAQIVQIKTQAFSLDSTSGKFIRTKQVL